MSRAAATALALVLAAGASAQEAGEDTTGDPPPTRSATPEKRPDTLRNETEDPAADMAGADASEQDNGADEAEPGEPGFVDPENEVDVVESAPPMPGIIAAEDDALAACHAELEAIGATFEIIDPITDADDADCGIAAPVEVTGLPGGVALDPAGQMRCETALALARWSESHVRPAAGQLPERGALASIDQGSTYICRRRNNRAEGKLSEHAFGNAIDIMAFRFETGEPIPVQPREREGTMAEAFQDAVRATACLHFTTVLGPGSDASHADHLHLDVKDRRGGFRLCQ